MAEFLIVCFWFSIFMIFYAYFGYPLALMAILVFRKDLKIKKSDTYKPIVSHIITAFNEEDRIKEKIENALMQDYPKEKMEVIVASDCSTDLTDTIVQSFSIHGVRLIRAVERKGKENAQKHAVDSAAGEVFVFSDVSTQLPKNAISCIVRNFADQSIGCVSSEDKFIDVDGSICGESAYVKYEMLVRRLESRVNTLVGLSGSFFAARREVCLNWATDLQSDFNTLLNSIKKRKKGVLDSDSHGYYKNIADEKKEFNRKARTVLRGITVLMSNLELINPIRYGFFSFQLFSHKLCRWIVPWFLIITFFSNLFLTKVDYFYVIFFILQILFYTAALIYFLRNRLGLKNTLIFPKKIFQIAGMSYYFTISNVSILVAWLKYFRSERVLAWEPSKR